MTPTHLYTIHSDWTACGLKLEVAASLHIHRAHVTCPDCLNPLKQKRKAYILRGLPGSGKSTLARMLAPKGAICSTDDFFYNGEEYVFDRTKLAKYHERNQLLFRTLCENHHPVVVCDNTNMKREHMRPYIEAAILNGYEVHVITVGHTQPGYLEIYAKRNKHGVDLDTINKMAYYFEPL